MMKVGLDIHGVIDRYPEFFSFLTRTVLISLSIRDTYNEIHIITGSSWTSEIKELLEKYEIYYTHYFSVTDYLLEKGEAVTWKDSKNPFFDNVVWNKAKAEYCDRNRIDFHFDDSDSYGQYFKTTKYIKVG
jgi:hypothetical protein